MQQLTLEQALIITAYTGILTCKFEYFHKYAESLLDRPIYTHEFGDTKVYEEIKKASKDDFLNLCYKD